MEQISSDLCTSCGLCCNGTIVSAVSVEKEKRHLFTTIKNGMISQPCEQLSECNTCAIYKDRPSACRNYRCKVLAAVESGKLSFDKAQEIINEVKDAIQNPQDYHNPNTATILSAFERYGMEPIIKKDYGDEFLPGMPLKIN
jgi:Fe-S-cluster containining protein